MMTAVRMLISSAIRDARKQGDGTMTRNNLSNAAAFLTATLFAFLSTTEVALSVDWADVGPDWGTGGSWVGGSEPGVADTAVFPSASSIANQPAVGATGTRTPLGISIDNTQADYSITGTGVLTLGSGGLTIIGGGTVNNSAEIRIETDQAWDIGNATVNFPGKLRLRNDTVATNLTISGPGTINFSGGEGSGGIGSAGDLNRTEGIMNINWGYAAHNSQRPDIVATGTGVVNLNGLNAATFLNLRAGGSGEIVAKANQVQIAILETGYTEAGGTITVADGVAISSIFPHPRMTGGTIRTQGTGIAAFQFLTYYKSSETAYLQGTIQATSAGNPDLYGGGGMALRPGIQGAGDYRLEVDADIINATAGETGLGLNHGYSGYYHGDGVIRLAGNNTYTGLTYFGGGTLLLANNAPVSAAGALGNASSAVVVGFSDRNGAVTILTDGDYTIARNFDIQEGTGNDFVTFGANAAGSSTFSGDVLLTSMNQANLYLTSPADSTVEFSGQVMPGAAKGVNKMGAGTVILSGDNSYSGTTTVSDGALVGGSNAAFGTGPVVVTAGTTIGVANNATITSNVTFGGTYTLIGNGTFKPANIANLTVGSGSTVSPGFSAGTITVGDVTLESGSNVIIEIFGANDYDRFISDGTMTINGGDLTLSFEGGYQPPVTGATYDIFGGAIAGTGFDNIFLPQLNGLRWDIDDLYIGGTISAIPEPTTAGLLVLAALVGLRRRR